jgi:catechol 2,3-dioxygenase-like lactoylglutathione lyase family enzyme
MAAKLAGENARFPGIVRISPEDSLMTRGVAAPEAPVRTVREVHDVLKGITPFLIVDDLRATIDFYESKLGFRVLYKGGGDDSESGDFWAFVGRDAVMIMLKAVAPDVHPQPNPSRHEWARWDAYVLTSDPDVLYEEFVGRGVRMHRELADTSDGLRAFEVADNNGYVLCFGRPVEK